MNGNLFDSFWMGGYECSDQLNCFGDRVNLLESSGHLHLLDEDYKNLAMFNIKTVREGIRWSRVDKVPFTYDWTDVLYLFEAAKKHNIQQVWDVCHFGFPDDLTPLHPHFSKRLTSVCVAFVELYKKHFPERVLVITPINEVSFISWLGGDVDGTSPYCNGMGWQVKYALMKAYIQAVKAIKDIDASIKILATEPLVNIVAPLNATIEQIEAAAVLNENQYQAMDMLCGKLCPELGGSPGYLDIAGFNYYYNNQWVMGSEKPLVWTARNENKEWVFLAGLLQEGYQRYGCPVIIAETSHAKEDRPLWIKYVGEECIKALQHGVDLQGICIYPIIDRTDWDHVENWHHSGIWDTALQATMATDRVLNKPYAKELIHMQQAIGHTLDQLQTVHL